MPGISRAALVAATLFGALGMTTSSSAAAAVELPGDLVVTGHHSAVTEVHMSNPASLGEGFDVRIEAGGALVGVALRHIGTGAVWEVVGDATFWGYASGGTLPAGDYQLFLATVDDVTARVRIRFPNLTGSGTVTPDQLIPLHRRARETVDSTTYPQTQIIGGWTVANGGGLGVTRVRGTVASGSARMQLCDFGRADDPQAYDFLCPRSSPFISPVGYPYVSPIAYSIGLELFWGTRDSRPIDGIGVNATRLAGPDPKLELTTMWIQFADADASTGSSQSAARVGVKSKPSRRRAAPLLRRRCAGTSCFRGQADRLMVRAH